MTGLLAVSALSIGTGESLELAQEELEKAKSAGTKIVTFDAPEYQTRLRQIYDPPLVLYVRGDRECSFPTRDCWRGYSAPHSVWLGHG